MGYPASVGVIWQVNDRVALRPELNVQKASGESTSTIAISLSSVVPGSVVSVTTSDSWQFSAGVSALFYLSTHDALRTYVSPRWAYTRTSNNSSSSTYPLFRCARRPRASPSPDHSARNMRWAGDSVCSAKSASCSAEAPSPRTRRR